jgi:Protein of unknown function (DUF2812).
MKKVIRLFSDVKAEQDWLSGQTGWKLTGTNGIRYIFEQSGNRYTYEYVYFEKSRKELDGIIGQITDGSVELVCSTFAWALFRKDKRAGDIRVFADPYDKYRMLMAKYNSYVALGACYLAIGSSQIALSTALNNLFYVSGGLFFVCSCLFFMTSGKFKKYAAEYDDGTYAQRMKLEKRR